MSKARVFKSGNSQAVRLPKQFRFQVNEIEIVRHGKEVILKVPERNLSRAFATLAAMPSDVMSALSREARRDRRPQKRPAL